MALNILQLGLVPYRQALELQRALVERRKAGAIADLLLLLEHPPVITLGRNAHPENVIASPSLLAARGTELVECDRGGDVTYHGPGQLVGYPICDLRGFTDEHGRRRTLWPVEFVRSLEAALIAACSRLGVACGRIPGLTGVWTAAGAGEEAHPPNRQNPAGRRDSAGQLSQRKLAAIGVHISRGVTSHGFALNVNADLSGFALIIPCGISDRPVTSLQRELAAQGKLQPGENLEMQAVARVVGESFARACGRSAQWLSHLGPLLPPPAQDTPLRLPAEVRRLRQRAAGSPGETRSA